MARYYVNKYAQSNGDHEVHVSGCSWMPDQDNHEDEKKLLLAYRKLSIHKKRGLIELLS